MSKLLLFIKNNKHNILFYILGFITIGLAVNMINTSKIGNGGWDTVNFNVRYFFKLILGVQWISIGMVSFTVSFILLVIVMSYRRQWKYLLMIIPILLVAISIDAWNIFVFYDRYANQLIYQIILFITGVLILPLGLTLIVKSSFPAFVFDELMLMFVKITKAKKITYVRLTIEIIGISIGVVFGYLTYYHADGTLGAVSYGSIIITLLISPIMAFYYKLLSISSDS